MARCLPLVLALWGCGSAGETEPAPLACARHEIAAGERCCPPGTWPEGGACREAGVSPDGCAPGFVHDGAHGCAAILADGCPAGQMPVLGEPGCQPIAACGEGAWGEIPIDGATVHVDASYAGGGSDGSAARPWTRIGEAVASAAPGALVAVAAGTYHEAVVLDRPVRLWGRCPERVGVVAPSGAALFIGPGAGGSEVRGLGLSGERGVELGGALAVRLEALWLHDVGVGVFGSDAAGVFSAVLAGSFIERYGDVAVAVAGGSVDIERSVIADGLGGAVLAGYGVFGGETASPTRVAIRHSAVVRARGAGIYGECADVELEGGLIRDTAADAQGFGSGLEARDCTDGRPVSIAVRGSVLERSHQHGVLLAGAELTLEDSVVRETFPSPDFGRGLSVVAGLNGGAPSVVRAARTLLIDNREIGLAASDSHLELRSLRIAGTQPNEQGALGHGVAVRVAPGLPAARVRGEGVVIEDCAAAGMRLENVEADLDSLAVRGTRADRSDGGHGVIVGTTAGGARARLALAHAAIEDNTATAVLLLSADAAVRKALLARTAQSPAGRFGDGLAVAAVLGEPRPRLEVHGCRIAQHARAGIASFGAEVVLGDVELACNLVHLNGERAVGSTGAEGDWVFDDRGGNVCGCEDRYGSCGVESSQLAPPPGL